MLVYERLLLDLMVFAIRDSDAKLLCREVPAPAARPWCRVGVLVLCGSLRYFYHFNIEIEANSCLLVNVQRRLLRYVAGLKEVQIVKWQ